MKGHPLSTTLGGAGCDLPSRQGEPGPSFICQAAPLTARTARCRGRGAGPRGRARGCVPAVPAVGRLLAQISLREALRGGDGATAAGLAAPHPRCAPGQAGRLGVCPTWDPLDSPEGSGECLRPGRLVLAGSCAAAAPGSGPHCAHLPSCSPRLLQMPNPPAGWAPPPPPPLPCWDSGTGPPSTPTQFFHQGRVRRGGSLCRRSSEWGRTRPKPGREAEESRSPGRMALKLIYDPLRGTARSQVGNSTFPAPRGAPCTAQRPLWPSTASPAVCGLGTGNPLPL